MTEAAQQRLAAVEYLLGRMVGWLDDDVLDDTAATILAELRTELTPEERRKRELAVELLTNGWRQREAFPIGSWVRGEGPRRD